MTATPQPKNWKPPVPAMTGNSTVRDNTQMPITPTLPTGVHSVDVNRVIVGDRVRADLGDIAELAASIEDVGLLNPITLTPTYQLVAGARRLAAVKSLGRTTIRANVAISLADAAIALRAEQHENTCRKAFTPSEAVAMAAKLEPLAKADAKKRQGARNDKSEHSGNFPPSLKSRDAVAAQTGMSQKTLSKAQAVVAAASADPSLAPVVQQMNATGKVDPAYKAVSEKQTARKPKQKPTADMIASARKLVRVGARSMVILAELRECLCDTCQAKLREIEA